MRYHNVYKFSTASCLALNYPCDTRATGMYGDETCCSSTFCNYVSGRCEKFDSCLSWGEPCVWSPLLNDDPICCGDLSCDYHTRKCQLNLDV